MVHTSKETKHVRPYTHLLQVTMITIAGGLGKTGLLKIVAFGHAVKVFFTAVGARIFGVGDRDFKLLGTKYECIATSMVKLDYCTKASVECMCWL